MTRRLIPAILSLLTILCAPSVSAPVPAEASTPVKSQATLSSPETALRRIQRMVARIDAEARTPEGEAAVSKRLSLQLGASEDSLKAQRQTWGLGYGELAMAYGFAKASRTGKTPADVVAMRSGGMDWFAISKELGVKVDAVANRMKRHVRPSKTG